MLWNAQPGQFDYFPDAWIEGTAVMMEHVGFNYVKDYLQYVPPFFSSPGISFFDGENNVYTNSLLTIFLFEKAPPSPRIDFPRTMFFNNFAKAIPFDANLRATAGDSTFKSSWVGLLNRFFTGSYFTGIRVDTSRFDLDAALMPWWTASPDSSSRSYTVTKTVNHYAMQQFDYQSDTGSFDTLTVNLACGDSAQSVANPAWAASCIVLGPGLPDSVFPLPIDSNGRSSATITGWRTRNEILVIPTNGDPVSAGYATVSFLAGAPVVPAAPILSQPANGAGGLGTTVTVSWDSSNGASTYAVQISTVSGFTSFAANQTGVTTLSFSVTGLSLNGTYYWRVNATNVSGTGAWSSVRTFSTFVPLAIFPDPPHLGGNNNFINFEGTGVQSVRIYALDGNLVTNSSAGQTGAFAKLANGLKWQLKNNRGRSVAPGYYRAVVEQKDTVAGINSTSVHKLLVFP